MYIKIIIISKIKKKIPKPLADFLPFFLALFQINPVMIKIINNIPVNPVRADTANNCCFNGDIFCVDNPPVIPDAIPNITKEIINIIAATINVTAAIYFSVFF